MPRRDLVQSLFINDVNVKFQSNSFVINTGGGEKNVEAHNKGNGAIEPVIGVDTSTKIGMVKFEVANTQDGRESVQTWDANTSNLIQVVYESGSILTFEEMVITTSPDIPGGADTNIEVEFQGSPSK